MPKGPFAHKKSQENFERKVHKRAIKAWDANEQVVDRWLKYLERHILGGVGVRTTRWQRVPVGIGKHRLKNVMDGMTDAEEVKVLGDKIVESELASSKEDAVVNIPV